MGSPITTSAVDLEAEYGDFLDLVVKHIEEDTEGLLHYGVRGMKWGVRKKEGSRPALESLAGTKAIHRTTSSGEKISISADPPTRFNNALARVFGKNYRQGYADSAFMTIRDKNNKDVGDLHLFKKSKDEIELAWVGIEEGARGKGYATAAVKASQDFARKRGYKKVSLTVMDELNEARHVYTKQGFKQVPGTQSDMVWEVPSKKVKHAEDLVAELLVHYGVRGMKWGVRRRPKEGATKDAERGIEARQRVKRSGTKALSNAELQDAITRMRLEQDFKRLRGNEASLVKRFVASTLLDIGKQQVQGIAREEIGNFVAKKRAG